MLIYKIASVDDWTTAKAAGEFRGSAVDLADGFIHFSTAEQVVETAARHFAGQRGLMLLAIDTEQLGEHLRWEPAPNRGSLFPHLYASLPLSAVVAEVGLPDDVPVDEAVARALATGG
ncbi:MAG: DUF952 domain-containing protein [Micromonosporaceae bacterium]|nr:DUF952 domain-containing protein [Micromonosporaceae bacterium]